MPTVKIISARSPYQIVIDEPTQIATKINLYIWNKGTTEPTIPTYVMSESIASVTQIETNYNISPFILEFIDKYKTQYDSTDVIEAGNNEWCIVKVIPFYTTDNVTWTDLGETVYIGVNGFTKVERGYNYDIGLGNPEVLLASTDIKVNWNTIIPYYNFICCGNHDTYTAEWYDKNGTLLKDIEFLAAGTDDYYNFAIPLVYGASIQLKIVSDLTGLLYVINTEDICEPKYPIQRIWFVNQNGGWNQYTFFKASYESINVKGSEYNLMQKNVDYDYKRGQTKPFNINGTKTLKVNSGWVEENNFDLIQELMLSDTILTEAELPLTIKTTSMQKKTYLKDKNINYTIEFEYSNNLINTIV